MLPAAAACATVSRYQPGADCRNRARGLRFANPPLRAYELWSFVKMTER